MSILVRSIREVSECFQQGVIKPSELLELCLQRLQKTSCLNAFITITSEQARQQALASDGRLKEGKRLGLLDGIPIAIKDNFSTKGVKTSCASRMLTDYVPPYNATVVQRLHDQGAVIIGKTNMDEFAMGSGTVDSIFGSTKNPHCYDLPYKLSRRQSIKNHNHYNGINDKRKCIENDWYIPGGSSGGSAVALASGTCFGALGSDTGGSTRNPASRCGVIGFKPTYGLVSRHGLIPLTNSMDVPGILTRTVDDAALMLGILGGHDLLDSTTVPDPFRPFCVPNEISLEKIHIGIPKEYHCPGLSKEIVEIWGKVADILEDNGARVSSVSMPHTQHSIVCYSVLNCCEVASNFARYDGIEYGHRSNDCSSVENLYAATRHEGFSEVVRGRILAGNYFLLKRNYDKYFVQAMKVRRLIAQDFDRVFESGVDLLLTPVTLTEAPLYSQWVMKDNREQASTEDFCTQPANMAGVPAVSFPCSFSSNGLPLSLQLIGQSFKEEKLLTIAKWLEQELNFPVWNLVE